MNTTLTKAVLRSALAAVLWTGAAHAQSESPQRKTKPAVAVKAGQIADRPAQYFGKEVKVTADVARVFGPRVFTLDEDKLGAGPDVAVLMPNMPNVPVGPDARVTVTGTVRQFVDADIYLQHGWFDSAGARIVHQLQARPVLVAREVQLSNGVIALGPGTAGDQAQISVSAGAIAANPMLYFGRKVTIRAEVEDLKDDKSFTLDEDRIGAGPDVLVLNPGRLAGASEGELVTVTGVVRPFVDASLRRDFEWFDATPGFIASFENRPVVVAENISKASDSNAGRGN